MHVFLVLNHERQHLHFVNIWNSNKWINVAQTYSFVSRPLLLSLVPRPLPDFISQLWRKNQLRNKIWEWPRDVATFSSLFRRTLQTYSSPELQNIHSLIIWTHLLVPTVLQVFSHYCVSGTVRKLIYSYPFWWVDFVAIPVFFSDRYSTLQSGSSTQDHRLMKNEIWTTFCKIQKQSCSVILKVVQFGQHSVPVSNVCWSPHWEWLLVANLSPML